jgi:alpha/beta superfamily hydrolase
MSWSNRNAPLKKNPNDHLGVIYIQTETLALRDSEFGMKEERVFFGKGPMQLEGLFAVTGGTRGAAISHPHSLMGGDMWNPVVETVAQALFSAEISTLRFNFRGVGGSSGSFDEGRGEQEDLLSALAFLEDRGLRDILPAGYSFGAWVTAGVIGYRALAPAIFVAPPIDLFPFDLDNLKGRVGLIVCGDSDPYCPADGVRIMATALSCQLSFIQGADHFFMSREADLADCIATYARNGWEGTDENRYSS